MKNKIIAIVGPTASGKTFASVELAKSLETEIISCDSMQVYKEMNIGTAKASKEEMQGIKHHLIDFLDVGIDFSVSEYVGLADKKIKEIHSKNKVPIIAGGTGLYVKSLIYGIDFKENSRDERLRQELLREVEKGNSEILYDKLLSLDAKACDNIHINNTKRLVRALEYCLVTGEKISEQSIIKEPKYDCLMLGISFRDREKLYDRINKRVDLMILQGLEDEAREYFKKSTKTSAQAIGYKELLPYFEGKISKEEAIDNIKRETRRYAKRQITWFKAQENINWFFIDDYKSLDEVLSEMKKCTNKFLFGGEKFEN